MTHQSSNKIMKERKESNWHLASRKNFIIQNFFVQIIIQSIIKIHLMMNLMTDEDDELSFT